MSGFLERAYLIRRGSGKRVLPPGSCDPDPEWNSQLLSHIAANINKFTMAEIASFLHAFSRHMEEDSELKRYAAQYAVRGTIDEEASKQEQAGSSSNTPAPSDTPARKRQRANRSNPAGTPGTPTRSRGSNQPLIETPRRVIDSASLDAGLSSVLRKQKLTPVKEEGDTEPVKEEGDTEMQETEQEKRKATTPPPKE